MAKLKNFQWQQIRDWFCPEPGYVLDFSNKTFAEFFEDHFETNIYSDAFSADGTSKFNRLRAFIKLSPPHLVIELLNILWRRRNIARDADFDAAIHSYQSDAFTTSGEYVEEISKAIDREDKPFKDLIASLASQPSHLAASHLSKLNTDWNLDTVEREMARVNDSLEKDPEAAITAASSLLEGVFRSVIISREGELPKQKDIKALYKCTQEHLGLSPKKELGDTEIETDVRSILGALSTSVQGIGALRTHAGTAHGRERGFRRVDPRIARLAVNTSLTIALFVVETWEKRFPNDNLKALSPENEPNEL